MESAPRDDDRHKTPELEELSRAECLSLLSAQSVGRIAVIAGDGLPFVAPVNYELLGDTIVFRTNAGTKLEALQRHPVAFQIDSIDPGHRAGWSVLVQGVAHEAAPHELTSVIVEPWLGPKQYWIQVVPRYISGRRIRLPDIAFDARAYT
ncbi:MAG TPA: pyridoxamine 5'-phosphate oxidase family protein [Ilumatobacteraceae bacterium]|nr:pyridoxamine 5'-phosphate oxidase family protein [Ilumatobacteraceae bacterium]